MTAQRPFLFANCASVCANVSGMNLLLVRRYRRKHPQLAARVPDLDDHLHAAEHVQNINAILLSQLREAGLDPVQEFRFHPARRWAFDLAFPELRIAVEVEGEDHRRRQRYASDITKYNAASELGWHLLRFRASHVHSRHAAREITRIVRPRLEVPMQRSALLQIPGLPVADFRKVFAELYPTLITLGEDNVRHVGLTAREARQLLRETRGGQDRLKEKEAQRGVRQARRSRGSW